MTDYSRIRAGKANAIAAGRRTKGKIPQLSGREKQLKTSVDSKKLEIRAISTKIFEIDQVLKAGPKSDLFKTAQWYELSWKLIRPRLPSRLSLNDVYIERANLIKRQHVLNREINELTTPADSSSGGGAGNAGGAGGDADNDAASRAEKDVRYNASAVKVAYFEAGQSFVNKADPEWHGKDAKDKFDNKIWSGNTPAKIAKAEDLWKKGAGSKGMIFTWNPPFGINAGSAGLSTDDQSTWANLQTNTTRNRYGFQFMYNPTTISMSYGGVADVDPSMQSSGTEEFLIANPTVFKSTINIDLVINRMYDMNYLNSNGLKSGQISDFYAGNLPTEKDLKDIYNKGTMYDIEFLLQTMFPYEPIESQLRGLTSDIGFLGASPVELHLGNNLKYVAQINNIGVNHTIFDNRMVPLLTTVSISTNRIPDYRPTSAS